MLRIEINIFDSPVQLLIGKKTQQVIKRLFLEWKTWQSLKVCSFGEEIQPQNFNTDNMNEVTTQTHKYLFYYNWINKLFSEEN